MRIGIMLRAYDRAGGVGVYARNIVKHLVDIDSRNQYVLFYNDQAHVGTYADRPHVEEVLIPRTNQLLWDQWHIARAVRRWSVDLLFNTKFSVPLMTSVKRIMVLHGASWFVHPELYGKLDIFYVRHTMPIYCRAADFLISNSELTTRDFVRILRVPDDKIETVRLAAGDDFRPTNDPELLESVRKKYELPERFILTVTSYDPRKNFTTLLEAFERCRAQTEIDMVVVGKDCHRYGEDHQIAARGLAGAIHFPDWIDQRDLPVIYSLAEVFAFPSVYEEFGIPVVEAMSCGCPVVSSSTGAIPDLVGDAGLLCDPFDTQALAENIMQVATSQSVRERCRERGLQKAADFSWSKAARQTLEIFRRVGG